MMNGNENCERDTKRKKCGLSNVCSWCIIQHWVRESHFMKAKPVPCHFLVLLWLVYLLIRLFIHSHFNVCLSLPFPLYSLFYIHMWLLYYQLTRALHASHRSFFLCLTLKRGIIQWHLMILKYNNRFSADGGRIKSADISASACRQTVWLCLCACQEMTVKWTMAPNSADVAGFIRGAQTIWKFIDPQGEIWSSPYLQ